MQNYTEIPSSTTLSDSLSQILNNDKTAISCNSGTTFPTTNLQIGMLCYRTDQLKLYQLIGTNPDNWRFIIDLSSGVTHLQGREVVRVAGVEIMPHSDEDECQLQAVYFPNGPELDLSQDLQQQVNQYGPNAFAICNPDWRSSGFGKCLMPWETHAKYWIRPHRGLLVAFDARAVHFQKPYMGELPFMQVLLNIKVERLDG